MVDAWTDERAETARRDAVLESALMTFARYGYRKASMDEIARTARISRPGLYYLFASKDALFRAAVTHTLEQDLAVAEAILADTGQPLRARLLSAFDRWAGRYIGPMSRDIPEVIGQNPDLLGPIVDTAPRRFEQIVVDALTASSRRIPATDVAQTLISASVGLKYQVDTRETFLDRLAISISLLVPPP